MFELLLSHKPRMLILIRRRLAEQPRFLSSKILIAFNNDFALLTVDGGISRHRKAKQENGSSDDNKTVINQLQRVPFL